MLFGLVGAKGSGKDETANYLKKYHGFQQYAFATPLKNICKELFDLNDEQLHGSLKEVLDPRWNTTPRVLFQKIGTEIFRRHLKNEIPELSCDNIWIKSFEIWFDKHKDQNCVISDCRFIDEIQSVKDRGGKIIIIRRNLVETDGHVSEQIHKEYNADYIIHNNSSIEELHQQLEKILSDLQ